MYMYKQIAGSSCVCYQRLSILRGQCLRKRLNINLCWYLQPFNCI